MLVALSKPAPPPTRRATAAVDIVLSPLKIKTMSWPARPWPALVAGVDSDRRAAISGTNSAPRHC